MAKSIGDVQTYLQNIELMPRTATDVRITKSIGTYLPYIALNSCYVNSMFPVLEKVEF